MVDKAIDTSVAPSAGETAVIVGGVVSTTKVSVVNVLVKSSVGDPSETPFPFPSKYSPVRSVPWKRLKIV